jgi:hypothetical protein
VTEVEISIPRCKKTRWAEGFTITCNAQLVPVAPGPDEPRAGWTPGLIKFLCPKCGDFYWIHASALPQGFLAEADIYNYWHKELSK